MLNGSIPSLDIFKPIPGQNIAQGGNMANTRVRMSFGHSSGTCIRNLLIPPKDNRLKNIKSSGFFNYVVNSRLHVNSINVFNAMG